MKKKKKKKSRLTEIRGLPWDVIKYPLAGRNVGAKDPRKEWFRQQSPIGLNTCRSRGLYLTVGDSRCRHISSAATILSNYHHDLFHRLSIKNASVQTVGGTYNLIIARQLPAVKRHWSMFNFNVVRWRESVMFFAAILPNTMYLQTLASFFFFFFFGLLKNSDCIVNNLFILRFTMYSPRVSITEVVTTNSLVNVLYYTDVRKTSRFWETIFFS